MIKMRTGYTTGACAAAAAKAALTMLATGEPVHIVDIDLPDSGSASFEVEEIFKIDRRVRTVRCGVKKDGGDDPDVTHGLIIYTDLAFTDTDEIRIYGGEGVGRVTRPGMEVPVGESAINQTPRKMINSEISDGLNRFGISKGVDAVVSVPGGRKAAEKTFNPRLGIKGGISIIGTSGIVKPYSDSAVKKSLSLFLDQAEAYGFDMAVMTPGSIGERAVYGMYEMDKRQVVHMSNFAGYMLNHAAERFKSLLVAGHPGKLAKIGCGYFNTHSNQSPSALPYIISAASVKPWYESYKRSIEESVSVEGVIKCIPDRFYYDLFSPIAERVEEKISRFIGKGCEIGVVFFSMDGSRIGCGKQIITWEREGCIVLR